MGGNKQMITIQTKRGELYHGLGLVGFNMGTDAPSGGLARKTDSDLKLSG